MKVSIRENQWGNWYGYIGTRRVEIFFSSPVESQEQAATKWLRAKQKELGQVVTPVQLATELEKKERRRYRITHHSCRWDQVLCAFHIRKLRRSQEHRGAAIKSLGRTRLACEDCN